MNNQHFASHDQHSVPDDQHSVPDDQHFDSDDEYFSPDDDDNLYSPADDDDGSFPVTNQVFSISGNKIHSLLLDDQSLRFSSRRFKFPEDFEEAWDKKWTTATKLEIKHSSIRSITKEDQDLTIRIVYRTYIGILSACEFCFFNAGICAAFLTYMEKEQYLVYTHEKMLPFKAVSQYILGLLFTIAMTWFCCYLVVDQKNGGTDDASDAKARLFLYVLSLLGEKGIIAIGIGISGYIGFKIWKRASNPPFRVKLARV